jgi:hypothetical protein
MGHGGIGMYASAAPHFCFTIARENLPRQVLLNKMDQYPSARTHIHYNFPFRNFQFRKIICFNLTFHGSCPILGIKALIVFP